MKIKRLDLKAYGHFTDCAIDFTSDTPGLHIIHGPNEAGKSTSLRALRGLLYGIPARTPDNFLHDYGSLLIGGQLQNSDGKELCFWRRKKNKGDLQDVDYNLLDDGILAEFLHGIEEPLFEALFGIDHETLVSGGKDILEQKGDIGRALFSAGAGLSSLHTVIEKMEQECEGLFKSGGSRPEINQAIKAYNDIKKEIRTLSLSSSAWKEQKEIYDMASSDLKEVEEAKRKIGSELERLKRLQRAIPNLVKRGNLKEELTALGDFSHLPHNFPERLEQALENRKQIVKNLRDAASRQVTLTAQKEGIDLRQDILDLSETIDALYQTLSVRQQAATDRPGLSTRLIENRTQAETLLNQVSPSLELTQTDSIKTLLDRRTTIQPLGNRCAGLQQALNQAKNRAETLTHERNEIVNQLEATGEVGDLRSLHAAIIRAQKAGDLDTTIRTLQRDITSLHADAEAELKRIGLWSGSAEELLSLPLPAVTTIDKFVEKFREVNEAQRHNRQEQEDVQKDKERVTQEIKAIEKAGSVATEEDLVQARNSRDYAWQLVKRSWLNGETLKAEIRAYTEDEELPQAFERGMLKADDLSDQLRASADRVHQYARLLADAEICERQTQRLKDAATQLTADKQALEQEWLAGWKGSQISPRSPKEMRFWIDQCQTVVRSVRDARQKESEKQPLIDQRQQLTRALIAELKAIGQGKNFAADALAAVLVYAEQVYVDLKAIQDKRTGLRDNQRRNGKELSAAQEELKHAQAEMTTWKDHWATALEGFGLPADATADDAANALDTLRTCLDNITQIAGLEERLKNIDQHARQFDASVAALVQAVAPELEGFPAEQAVAKLQSMVKDAEKNKSVLEKIEDDWSAVAEEMRQAGVEQQAAEDALVELRKLAHCEDDESLLRVKESFQTCRETQKQLASLEDALVGIAEGVALEVLEEQRQAVDPNELPGQIEQLARQIQDELEPQMTALAEKRGEARNALQSMDGSDEAAAMEEQAQAALAKVRRLADRYIRVRLGSQLLKQEIERYRQENQDPILKAASRYFVDLTLGSFTGLRSDIDDQGHPILVGVDNDGRTRTVEEMSSGTRDQLYLALRLATLEWRLEKHEPMPFVADDILVNFDDQRSTATLKALAELAKKNQVILFTHHQQIIETVESLGMQGHVVVHPLNKKHECLVRS